MGVVTSADEHLYEAKENISKAVSELSEIVINKCWGHDDFSEEYKAKIKNTFLTLLELRDDLGG